MDTSTQTATNTPTLAYTYTPTVMPTACVPGFTDVQTSDWYYDYVAWMYCQGVVTGYNTDPPCSSGVPCYKPETNTSRGQMAKIIVRAFDFSIDISGGPHFTDVAPGSTFYDYMETGSNLALFSGYPDGTYRPDALVTRGQISKIAVNAAITADPAHWTLESPSTNTFEDVPIGSTFFRWIETAVTHGVLEGYPCDTAPAGTCIGPDNKPYFLPNNDATRAQIAKITYITVNHPPANYTSK